MKYKLARKIKSILNSDFKACIINNNNYSDLFNLENVRYGKFTDKDKLSLIWLEEIDYIHLKRVLYDSTGSIESGTVIVCEQNVIRAIAEFLAEINKSCDIISFRENKQDVIIKIL